MDTHIYGIGTGKERDKTDRQRPREGGQMDMEVRPLVKEPIAIMLHTE